LKQINRTASNNFRSNLKSPQFISILIAELEPESALRRIRLHKIVKITEFALMAQ